MDSTDLGNAVTKDIESPTSRSTELKRSENGLVLVPQPSDDPSDPLNWPDRKKSTTLAIWSFAGFSSHASALTNLQGYFLQAPVYGKTPVEVSYSISAALAGLLVGAVLVVPLSRKFGSCFCLLWSTLGVLITAIWSACMTGSGAYNAFIVSRLFAGIFASVPLIVGSQCVLDIFFLHQRGRVFHILHIPYLLGVVAGPTFGGYVVSRTSWPVQFWWTVGMNGFLIILILVLLENTEYDRDNNGRSEGNQPANNGESILTHRVKTYFFAAAVRQPPSWGTCAGILFNEVLIGLCPISILAGLFLLIDFGFATVSGVLNVVFLEDPLKKGGYGFNSIQTASFMFNQWIGILLAELYGHFVSDRIPLWICHRRGDNIWKPEYRLYCLAVPAVILPIGLGLFASALQYHLHWVVLALGSILIFAAGMSVVPIIMTYLCECFSNFVPETQAIMGFYRLAFSLTTTFFVPPWVARVTVGWVFGTGAFLTIPAFALFCGLIWFGPKLRKMTFSRLVVEDKVNELTDLV